MLAHLKMTRHKKIHQTKYSPTSPKVVQKVKSNIGFGTFVRTEKESTTQEFLCAQCSKTCRDSHNLERHIRQVHLKKQKKKKKNRTTVMRKVKQMLSDEDFLREMNRQRNINAPSATIDETLIETIMANIPMISNRNIVKTLSILRNGLPNEKFKSNLREVIAKRTNFLEDLFESMFTDVVEKEGETINMPVTYNLPPFECMQLMLLKISVFLIWIIFVTLAKCAPELATPAKSVYLS